MRYQRLLPCMLLALCAVGLVAEEKDEGEGRKSAGGQFITVAVQGDARASLLALLVQRNLGQASDPGLQGLAAYLAQTCVGLAPSAKEFSIHSVRMAKGQERLKAYQDAIARLAAVRPPAEWLEGLKPTLARQVIQDDIRGDMHLAERVKSILSGATVVKAEHSALVAAIQAAFPGMAQAKPEVQKAVWDEIDALNPGLYRLGWQIVGPATPEEAWPHLDLRRDGAIFRYRYQPQGGPILIPARARLESVAAQAQALPQEYLHFAAPRRWSTQLELPGAIDGKDARMLIAVDDEGVVSAVVIVPSAGNRILPCQLVDQAKADGALLPEPGKYRDQPYWPLTLTRTGDSVAGFVLLPASSGKAGAIRLELEVKLDAGKAHGTFSCGLAGGAKAKGAVRGVVPAPAADPLLADGTWSTFQGSLGCGSAGDKAPPMVEALDQVKLGWISHDRLPHGEGSDMRSSRKPGETVMGGFSSPAVAGNRVFLVNFRPAGTEFTGGLDARERTNGGALFAVLRDADDVVTAFDASSGATLWKTVFPRKGHNRGGMHKTGYQGSPCVVGDAVYAMGTTLRLYCLDAATGVPRWESDLGVGHRRIQEAREHLSEAEQKKLGKEFGNRGMNGMPRLIDGIIVISDAQRFSEGLVGLDPANGKRLWSHLFVAQCPVPLMWRKAGREYAIAVSSNSATAIDPRDGRILWRQEGFNSGYIGASTVCGDVLFGFDAAGAHRVAYRMSETGCEKIWELPPELTAPFASPAMAHRGRIYCFSKDGASLLMLDPATGKVLAKAEHAPGAIIEHGSLLVAAGDRLWSDNGRELPGLFTWNIAGDKIVSMGLLGAPRAAGYAVSITPALVDGRMFMRLHDRLACFDFRR